ncbi:endoribonuclease YBEY, chloroplastic isoform X3 [Zea mays]|uniref:endoribonuclease YBEY, chloroplastic isoform X3 n=1 Tax=Zea mays TaxID=4577 RepID=UPI000182BC62|nr:endoribonuclease YBEY, chloroplastic isoform X3 [Zea mays]XP_035815040.1 endoribonuclease YBEY, chloroplastic isoform X3 [Zea mays]XP_035815041.1 endoribonuclease YBEY, chloroplastic isoform X3 [Zea mays]|eukprot:XP_023155959.1 endoribonuclease YBEY, chloroplastic isoform X3 [Zea mays]
MVRLHQLLSRTLASHQILASATSSVRSTPRLLLPLRLPPPAPPPHGRTLLPIIVAASRQYASSTFGRRGRSTRPPMLLRRKRARSPTRKGPGELRVQIGIEEALPDDPGILSIAETLRTDVGKAVKLALNDLEGSDYMTRDPSICNVDKYASIEVSVLLCDDDFIRKLNKEWRDEDHATDVLSMSQHIPELDIPILQLGDIVISVDTARRQAEERGHTLVDEIRILMVHGLLHLLGFDHEVSKVAEEEMEKEEEHILNTLEWRGKGLIKSAYDIATVMEHLQNSVEADSNIEKVILQEKHQPKLSHIICDIDGTIMDYEGGLHEKSIGSLREAIATGVNVIMVTGKGSLIYGRDGKKVHRAELDLDVCKEALLYSLKHRIPLVAYCEEQCLTLFEHPFVELLHTVHNENKVKVMHSIEDLLEYSSIQKLLLFDSTKEDSSVLRQHFSELSRGKAHVIKMHSNTIDIVPLNTSKGGGLRILLDHLGITKDCDLDSIGDYTRWLSNK